MKRLIASRRVMFFLLLALTSLAAGGLLFYGTPYGLGLNDDSIAYIAGARSLLSGQGYREIWLDSAGFVTHFPPGFPGTLAGLGLLTGLDPLRAARLLNGLLFALNTLLMGWLALRMTGSRVVAALTAVLFVLTPSFLRIHSNAMSEPLYVFFTLAAFLLLDIYFRRLDDRPSRFWLVAAGCLIGMAYLTRYAALALLGTALVALVLAHTTWRARLQEAAILTASFLPWAAAWAIRNRLVGGSLTNRALGWHPINEENIQTGLRTFSSFVIPIEAWQTGLFRAGGLFATVLIVLGLGLLAWILYVGIRQWSQPGRLARFEIIPFLNALYIFGYFVLLGVTMTFFDPATKFQLRIVAPMLVSLMLLLAYALNALADRPGGRRTALVLSALVLVVSAFGQGETLAGLRRGGQVYANERWFDAPAIAALRQLPSDVAIHSNQPGVVYLYVGRPGSLLPDHATEIPGLQAQVRAGRAVIAIFKSPGISEGTLAYYDLLGKGLLEEKYNGDVIYSAP